MIDEYTIAGLIDWPAVMREQQRNLELSRAAVKRQCEEYRERDEQVSARYQQLLAEHRRLIAANDRVHRCPRKGVEL